MDVITDGLKHDGGKPRLSLVPGEAIEAIGAVMTHGAEKYGQASYKQVAPERYRDALMRHVCKWLKDPHLLRGSKMMNGARKIQTILHMIGT